tara:strand:- start:363 stop:545 length:183 start_codon:yes stop_codon:yes gene_type:complete
MQIGDLVMHTQYTEQIGVVSKIYGGSKTVDVQWVTGSKTCVAISKVSKVGTYNKTDKKCP